MKTSTSTILRIALPLLSFSLATACVVATGGRGAPVPGEPATPGAPVCADATSDFTDSADTPSVLAAASSTTGCLTSGDVDLLAVTAPAGGAGTAFRIRLQGNGTIAPQIEILDASRKRLHSKGGRPGETLTSWAHVAGGTALFIRISQVHSETGTYTLTLEPTAIDEAGEPNDTYEQATALAENGTLRGALSLMANGGELTDWYRLDVSANGKVTIVVDMSPTVAPVLEVLDSSRARVAYVPGSVGQLVQAEFVGKKGTYYISIGSVHSLPAAGDGDLPAQLTRPYVVTTTRL